MYQLINNDAIKIAQSSGLGVTLGSLHVASIGAADDIALVSSSLDRLQCLVRLSEASARRSHTTFVASKTKLLVFHPRNQASDVSYVTTTTPLVMDNTTILPTTQADHLGILRSTKGNMASVMARLSAYNRALYSVLPAGLARHHASNPAAALRVHKVYAEPVLLSGLASLILTEGQLDVISHAHKMTLQRLQKLHNKTPRAAVYLTAGCLPIRATLHQRQLGLFGMVARLGPDHILHKRAVEVLSEPSIPARVSWFAAIRDTMATYGLPHPHTILSTPPTKQQWTTMVHQAVLSHWQAKLVTEATALPSLSFLRATHLSLTRPHLLWSTCPSGPLPSRQAALMARLLSGRYQSCWHRRHIDGSSGACKLPGCGHIPGDVVHIFSGSCPALSAATSAASMKWTTAVSGLPTVITLLQDVASRTPLGFTKFLFDPSTDHAAIKLAQASGKFIWDKLFYLVRTWLYTLHRECYRKLGLSVYLT